jgi:hypothetical protein
MRNRFLLIVVAFAFYISSAYAQSSVADLSNEFINHVGDIGDDPPATQAAFSGVIGGLGAVVDAHKSLNDLLEATRTLDAGECSPAFEDKISAQMVSTCAEDATCAECYQKAVQSMNFYRKQLARAHCLYVDTKKFTESAVAFGDNASGIHAVSGIAWQKQRGLINANFENFKLTYDSKSKEFLEGLGEALVQFAMCENQYGQQDWYQKSGFIYYEFMKEKYRRAD